MIEVNVKTWFLLLILILTCNKAYQQTEDKTTIWTVAWSPNGKYIAAGGNQDVLKLFDGKTFELIKTYPVKGVQLSRIKWHPFKNMLAIVTQSKTIKARILDLDKEVWVDLQGLKSSFRGLDWNYTGNLLAVSELEAAVSVYKTDGTLVSRFLADPKAVAGLDWHPSKNIMVTVGSQIGIYNHLGDTIKTFWPRLEEAFLLCVEWHVSGDFFVVGDYGDLKNAKDKMVQFWNMEGTKRNEIKGSTVEYRNIRWHPDGEKLATASDALSVWSKGGELLSRSKSTEDYLWGIDWSPDGKYIVTSSKEGKIIIWDKNANSINELK
ncbi:WD40 repeat domain-containing protein [Ulvibacterium marinum]|uniref:WD40 repeat domain-containing protein n=1 Tax=Ulvibacterium marinum TaxID=2419782 RepID=UPI002495603D|nr:hypothetical protein [Ulvibacterium marinum]